MRAKVQPTGTRWSLGSLLWGLQMHDYSAKGKTQTSDLPIINTQALPTEPHPPKYQEETLLPISKDILQHITLKNSRRAETIVCLNLLKSTKTKSIKTFKLLSEDVGFHFKETTMKNKTRVQLPFGKPRTKLISRIHRRKPHIPISCFL